MAKTEVAVLDKPGELAPITPTVASMYDSVSLNDIVLPRLYLQQPLSNHVSEGLAKPGDLILAAGTEDPVPIHLIGGDEGATSVVVYVIGREKFAATTAGGGIEFHADKQRDRSDPDSWEGWFFDLAIPSADTVVPARWMLWKTSGAPTARAINTLIERKAQVGDYDPLAVRITVTNKTSKKGQPYFAPKVAPAERTPEDMEIALRLRDVALSLRHNRGSENTAPVSDQPSFS